MKNNSFIQFLSMAIPLTLAAVVLSGAVSPEPKESSDQRLVREAMEILAKYDSNGNRQLDDDENALLQADKRKAATEKRLATIARKKAEAEGKAETNPTPGK